MSKRPRPRKAELPPCADLRDDDQVDPRKYFDRRSANSGMARRARMVCAQVEKCLHLALLAVDDERLLDVSLEGVFPAPDSSRLLIRIRVHGSARLEEAKAALDRGAVSLRMEVAQALQRRRVPELVFEVIGEDAP